LDKNGKKKQDKNSEVNRKEGRDDRQGNGNSATGREGKIY